MDYLRSTVLIVILSLIAGCSQKFQDVNATMNEALWGFNDITMTAEQVAELPYASLYVRINHGPQIFMVLAFADINPRTNNTQLKWFSADGAMITTENGRITKTSQLPQTNLTGMTSTTNLTLPIREVTSWENEYDWQPGYHYGKTALVQSYPAGFETIRSLLWEAKTTKIREVITFHHSQKSMANHYWIDQQGQVVKSAQWLIPNDLFIEFESLKMYAE